MYLLDSEEKNDYWSLKWLRSSSFPKKFDGLIVLTNYGCESTVGYQRHRIDILHKYLQIQLKTLF